MGFLADTSINVIYKDLKKRFGENKVTVGPNGNWFIGGVDTGERAGNEVVAFDAMPTPEEQADIPDDTLVLVKDGDSNDTAGFAPSEIISADAGNALTLGSDGKLFAPPSSGGGSGLAPGDCSNIAIAVGSRQARLSWNDPEDTVLNGTVIAEWAETIVVRKTGSYPVNEHDGAVVVESAVRNQYALAVADITDGEGNVTGTETTGGFADAGLENDVEYFYGFFAKSKTGAVNTRSDDGAGNAVNRISGTPFLELSPPISNFMAKPGNGFVDLSWINPGGTFKGITIIRKEYGYPSSITDGFVVTNSSAGTHVEDPELINGRTYYYRAFTTNGEKWNDAEEGQTAFATPDIGEMIQFFTIPGPSSADGVTGDIWIKVEKPVEASSVMIRYKTEPWTDDDNVDIGILVTTVTDDTPYRGPNQWFKATGLDVVPEYHFKAFPDGAWAPAGINETKCKAGGLVAEYTFDSISGTTLYDSSGNGYNAVLTNMLSEAGIIGEAGRSAGNGYVTAPAEVIGVNKSGTTITGFLNIKNIAGSLANSIVTFAGPAPTSNAPMAIFFGQGTKFWLGNGAEDVEYSFANLELNTPTFFACGHNPSSTTYLSINNIGKKTQPFGTRYNYKNQLFVFDSDSRYYTNGSLDQVRFWSRVLEDYELTNLYNGGAGC
jgi:hypothetical protein